MYVLYLLTRNGSLHTAMSSDLSNQLNGVIMWHELGMGLLRCWILQLPFGKAGGECFWETGIYRISKWIYWEALQCKEVDWGTSRLQVYVSQLQKGGYDHPLVHLTSMVMHSLLLVVNKKDWWSNPEFIFHAWCPWERGGQSVSWFAF